MVQIRGSIPLFWTSKPNKSWSPPVVINEDFDRSIEASLLHFNETKKYYGDQFLVNLIDQKGDQQTLGNEFTRLHTSLEDEQLKYVWFDFHHECQKMKWGNLSKLLEFIKEDIDKYGSFMASFNLDGN